MVNDEPFDSWPIIADLIFALGVVQAAKLSWFSNSQCELPEVCMRCVGQTQAA